MKKLLAAVSLCILSSGAGFAQQAAAPKTATPAAKAAASSATTDAPATKEDVERYLEVMRSREMMTQMVDAMLKPMHQMIHEQYLKDKDNLPPDFETHMTKMMDDTMKGFPWDEILESMVPVYQKHITKRDIDAIIMFYSGSTGQKLLKDMPAMMSDAMQAAMPLMQSTWIR